MLSDVNDELSQITISMSKEEVLTFAQRLIELTIADERMNCQGETGGVRIDPHMIVLSQRTRAHGVPLVYMIKMTAPVAT